ncbi:MAG: RNA polymerase sigma factor [Phycisphaerales bacterium]
MDDSGWIREAVDAWEQRLVAYATRLLNGDVDLARDVVQDTFMRLWEADRAQVEDHLDRWLYTVCRRRAIDVHRKEHRMHASSAITELETAKTAPTPPPDEGSGLLDAVGALPERQREAVRLRFQGGLSYADIATVMQTTSSNVGVLLHTALQSLRERLGTPSAADAAGGTA